MERRPYKAMGVPTSLIGMVKTLNNEAKSRIIINAHLTEEITVLRGVRQGCPLSPSLFEIIAEVLASKLHHTLRIKELYLSFKNHTCCTQHSDDTTVLVADAFLQGYRSYT